MSNSRSRGRLSRVVFPVVVLILLSTLTAKADTVMLSDNLSNTTAANGNCDGADAADGQLRDGHLRLQLRQHHALTGEQHGRAGDALRLHRWRFATRRARRLAPVSRRLLDRSDANNFHRRRPQPLRQFHLLGRPQRRERPVRLGVHFGQHRERRRVPADVGHQRRRRTHLVHLRHLPDANARHDNNNGRRRPGAGYPGAPRDRPFSGGRTFAPPPTKTIGLVASVAANTFDIRLIERAQQQQQC